MPDEETTQPADGRESEAGPAQESPPALPVVPAGTAPAVPERKRRFRRTKKSKLLEEAKQRLDPWSFFKGHSPNEEVRFVVRGPRIGATAGDGEAIGLAMQRYARLLRVLDADPMVDSLAFGNSVTITFRADPAEVERAQRELVEARAKALDLIGTKAPSEVAEPEGMPVEATAEDLSARLDQLPEKDRTEIEAAFGRAVTDIQTAAAAAAQLIAAPASAAPAEAVAYGTDVAEAYKTFASAVVRSKVTVELDDPGRDTSVSLDGEKAGRVVDELRAASKPTQETVTVFGILSQADAEVRGFGLRLAADAPRPDELKGKRMVRGTYRPDVGAAIRDQGLWGKEVKARIVVERDALISTSTIRPPKYMLLAVAPRFT